MRFYVNIYIAFNIFLYYDKNKIIIINLK